MDRGTDVQLAWAEPPVEQGLRAEGADQRVSNGSRDDPAHLEATGEVSLSLAKQALSGMEAGPAREGVCGISSTYPRL